MILVTGSTGNAGGAVARALVDAGEQVRAVVREAYGSLLPEGVEPVAGDLNRAETLEPHLDGITAAFRLSGPQALRPIEQVAILARATGRELRFEPQSDEEARAEMEAAMPKEYVDAFFSFFAEGTVDETTVHPTVREILGREPLGFEQWA